MDINELIERIDIVEYISQYIDLEQKGDEWWGLSCFKEEKTPSFSIRRTPPVFYDYSSGIGGNVYTFVRYKNKCSGKEAVEILKKYAGIEGEVSSREKLAATRVFKKYQTLQKTEKVSCATKLPPDYMKRYERPPEKLKIWLDEGISQASLDKFEVAYDAFSNRIVYPIRDINGNIVNIGGRTLDPDWKEKKQRKYCYFYSWGTLNTLYGLAENEKYIKEKGEIILFEGAKSVMIADTWGIHNTAAILTSHLSPHQMKILAKLGCRAVFALDRDVDITKDHNIQKLKQYINVEFIKDALNLTGEKDSPVDRGKETFEKLYETRKIIRNK